MGKWKVVSKDYNEKYNVFQYEINIDGRIKKIILKEFYESALDDLITKHNIFASQAEKYINKLKKQIEDLKQQNVEFAGSLIEDDIQKDKVIDTIKYLLKLLGDK